MTIQRGSPAEAWRHSHNYEHHTFSNIRGKDRDQAIAHYRRVLKLAPSGNAYIDEAQKALAALHAPPEP